LVQCNFIRATDDISLRLDYGVSVMDKDRIRWLLANYGKWMASNGPLH